MAAMPRVRIHGVSAEGRARLPMGEDSSGLSEGRIQRRPGDDEVGDNHWHGIDRQPVDHPKERGPGLNPPEHQRLAEQVGAREHGRGEPSDHGEAHLTTPARGSSRSVTQSVRALSHSCNTSPWEAKSCRIRTASQPTTSSRTGTRTLTALSLTTVRWAIRVMCLASDTAIVKPFALLTCNMTWISELPSPT